MRARTSALTFVGALVVGALAPGAGLNPLGMLHAAARPQAPQGPGRLPGALGPAHPVIDAIAPPDSLSPAARHTPPATGGPHCDSAQPRGGTAAYQGPSVSALYDRLFSPNTLVPNLSSFIPQSLVDWPNWDDAGHDLLLLGMYRAGSPSYLVGIDPDASRVVATVAVEESHLGGLAFLGDWLFTGDNPWPHPGSPTVRRYRVAELRNTMLQAAAYGSQPYLRGDGPRQPVHATDFMATDGDAMYAGNHGNPADGVMYRYSLDDDGWLRAEQGPWAVPARAQGLVITPDDFVFSTDNNTGRGELVVVRRESPGGHPRPIGCIWMPSMPEGIAVHHRNLLATFESGAARYSRDDPTNRISHLHSGSLGALLSTVDPVALDAENALGIAPAAPDPAFEPTNSAAPPAARASDAADLYASRQPPAPARFSDARDEYERHSG